MPKRKPRVVGRRRKEERDEWKIRIENRKLFSRVQDRILDAVDEVYRVIEEECVRGYRFTDSYYGIPFIERSDIEEMDGGVFVVRFRCDPRFLHAVFFGRMSQEVCKRLRSEYRFVHELKSEWGIPFEECAWVLVPGEVKEKVPFHKEFYTVMSEEIQEKTETVDKKPSPKKCTHERWNEFLTEKYGRTLLDVASELGYSSLNLEILACDKNDRKSKMALYKGNKALFDAFLKTDCADLRDGRNPLDYFKDLIASWVGEDLLVRALNEYGFKAEVANADKDRVIKTTRKKITCAADIKVEFEGNTRNLELMDALSPVAEYGQFELRLEKAKKQFENGNLFLLQSLSDGKFVLIDFMRESLTVKYNAPHPRWGGKSSSAVVLEENGISMHPMALLWETLKGVMFNTKPEPFHKLTLLDFQTGEVKELVSGTEQGDESSVSVEDDDENSQDEIECSSRPEQESDQQGQQGDGETEKREVEKTTTTELETQEVEIQSSPSADEEVDLSDVSDESEEQTLDMPDGKTEEDEQPTKDEPSQDEGLLGGGFGDFSEFV